MLTKSELEDLNRQLDACALLPSDRETVKQLLLNFVSEPRYEDHRVSHIHHHYHPVANQYWPQPPFDIWCGPETRTHTTGDTAGFVG